MKVKKLRKLLKKMDGDLEVVIQGSDMSGGRLMDIVSVYKSGERPSIYGPEPSKVVIRP